MTSRRPRRTALSRRGVLVAGAAGIGAVVVTSVGQTLTPLEPVGLLAVRQWTKGPQGVPVNKTAEQAGIIAAASARDWQLRVAGRTPYVLTLADLDELAQAEADLPITCVEGWSVGAHWRGVPLLEVVRRAGGGPRSRVRVVSLEQGLYGSSVVQSGRRCRRRCWRPTSTASGSTSTTATRCASSARTGRACSTRSGSPGGGDVT